MQWIKKLPTWLLIAIPPMLMILPTLGSFHYASGTEFSDVEITHYPNLLLIQQSLAHGVVPLWNPYILGGYPFDADPLSGLWYPPGWLALLMPLKFGINLVVMLHIIAGGVGMYFLLQRLGVSKIPALTVGLMFSILPKVYAHFGAGHITYLFAFSLTTWLCFAGLGKGRTSWIWQALLISGMVLADVRWLPFGLLCWLAAVFSRQQSENDKHAGQYALNAAAWLGVAAIICAGALTALFQFTGYTTRSALTEQDASALALPIVRLVTIFFPSLGVTPEWMVYAGLGIPLLAFIGICSMKVRRTLPWLLLLLISIIFSLGNQVPGFNLLASIPGLNLLRVPTRAMFAACLALLVLAGFGLEVFRSSIRSKGWILWATGFLLVGSARLTWLSIRSDFPGGILWIITPIIILVMLVLFNLRFLNRISYEFMAFTLTLFLLLDFGLVSRSSFTTQGNADDIPRQVLDQLPAYPAARIYSPDYAIGQSAGMDNRLAFAQGVHPMQLGAYVNLLAEASGVAVRGYSVVQPPLATGNPAEDNKSAIPDTEKLARLNVSHVLARNPISRENLTDIYHDGNLWVYQNASYTGFPVLMDETGNHSLVDLSLATPNRMQFNFRGEGRFVTADVNYPGWRAALDGKYVAIHTVDGVFREVDIPQGEHTLIFAYHPWLTYLGWLLGAICALILITGLREKSNAK